MCLWEREMNRNLIKKTVISLIGIFILIYIAIHFHYSKIQKEQAPYIENAIVLTEMELISSVKDDDLFPQLEEILSAENDLSYGDYLKIKELYPLKDFSFEEEYKRKKWKLSLKHWNEYFEQLVSDCNDERISVEELLFVGDGSFVTTDENLPLEDGTVFTSQGVYKNDTAYDFNNYFSKMKVFCYEDRLISVMEEQKDSISLKNCYLIDDCEDKLKLMKGAYFVSLSNLVDPSFLEGKKEEIVDIIFQDGKITDVVVKNEYINGKLLRVDSEEIEIEGYGIFPLEEDMEIYRLYKELKSMGRKELALGYNFTDFVLEDGKIAACLMMREEYMEYIRVLLRTADLEKKHHDEIILSCDEDMEMISYVNGIEAENIPVPAGEKITLSVSHFSEDLSSGQKKRIKFLPSVLSGKISLHNVDRSQGVPVYKGSLELMKQDEGLIVVNELLLEDYLKHVVPSEMPAYYPMEALKAQAVCARTYAYGKMVRTGLAQYGAHVDDSAAFQVYNNITTKAETTEAVNSTYHEILSYEDHPIGAYYYSTSAGSGSEIAIWHGSQEEPPYLKPRELNSEGSYELPDQLKDEDKFKEFITSVDSSHFEAEEGWYRWKVYKEADSEDMLEVIKKRYELYPEKILVENEEGEFISREIPSLGEIKNLEITKRMAGGIADELVITGENAIVKVISELNIRHILSAGKSEIERQSGDTVNFSMLPSAFICLDLSMEDDNLKSYTVIGGGFGHGIGMSQNAAKNMAKQDMNYRSILNFYYTDAELTTLSKN